MSLQAYVPIPGCYIGPWSWGGNYQLVSFYLCPIYLGHWRVLFGTTVPSEHGRIHPDVSYSSDVLPSM